MNKQVSLRGFYKKTLPAIIILVRDFITRDFYSFFPELKGKISLYLIGSVSQSNYDKLSDIDVELACSSKVFVNQYMEMKRRYNLHLRRLGEPVQFHRMKTFATYRAMLKDWSNDNVLRELSSAIIIDDPRKRFAKLQREFRYYPKAIHKDKIAWLFGEMNFDFYERYRSARQRENEFFCTFLQLKMLRFGMNALLLAHQCYPAFDKHIYRELQKIRGTRTTLKKVDQILKTRDIQKNELLLLHFIHSVEKQLLTKRLISNRPAQYWIDLRPKHKVQVG